MRILLLEDEAPIREVEAAYLRKAGFEVEEFSDGTAALQALSGGSFDLFLIDINVPGMNGLEVCKRLRAHTLAPIVLVTARSSDIDELIGLECGADDYIKKPFNPDILVARVRALLRHHGEKTLVFRTLSLDPATQTATKDGTPIRLTATQFKILHLLASTPGRIYTRGEIVDYAYGDPFDCAVLERTVDAHVKRMRKALDDSTSQPRYIHTAIGKGYFFKEDRA